MLLESIAGTKRRVRIESRHKSTRYSIDPGSEISQCQGCFFFFFSLERENSQQNAGFVLRQAE